MTDREAMLCYLALSELPQSQKETRGFNPLCGGEKAAEIQQESTASLSDHLARLTDCTLAGSLPGGTDNLGGLGSCAWCP